MFSILPNKYDFDLKNWDSPWHDFRNVQTIAARIAYAGNDDAPYNHVYEIKFRGFLKNPK